MKSICVSFVFSVSELWSTTLKSQRVLASSANDDTFSSMECKLFVGYCQTSLEHFVLYDDSHVCMY